MSAALVTRSRRRSTGLLAVVTLIGAVVVAVVVAQPASAVENIPLPASGSIVVTGNGNGHGHGLSQYGARGAAAAGLTAAQIINFYYPGTTRVTLANSSVRVQITAAGTSTMVASASGLTLSGVGALTTVGVSRFRLVASAGTTLRLDKLVGSTWSTVRDGIASGAEFSRTGGVRLYLTDATSTAYRGVIRALHTGSTVTTVNRVSLDEYTEGVVPREMPASWAANAVQAQAIAARSYGRNAVESHTAQAYDICDTSQCQVYGGMTHYDSASNTLWTDDPAALTGNANVVQQYGGTTIFAQFSASNGGWTVDGGQPYLVAKQDPYDNAASGDPYLNWSRTVSVAAIATYYGLSSATKIEITARDGHGMWGGRVTNGFVDGVAGGKAAHVATTGFGLQDAMGLPTNWFHLPTSQLATGHLDGVTLSAPGVLKVRGWTYDPDHPDSPGSFAVHLDNAIQPALPTTASRVDVQRAFNLGTATVGFDVPVKVSPGSHTVCVYGLDRDSPVGTWLGCATITMPDPIGHLDETAVQGSTVRLRGWTFDPDHGDRAGVYQTSIDGKSSASQNDPLDRPDVQGAYRTVGKRFGFNQTLTLSAGAHTVCVLGVDQDGGRTVPIQCVPVTIP